MTDKVKEKKIVVGFWLRLVSDIFDAIILGLFGFLLSIPFRDFFYKMGEDGLWLGLVITFLYTGILQSSIGQGQSLAKKALKIQVLRKNGSYLSLPRSFARYLIIAMIFYNQWIGTALFNTLPFLRNDIFSTIFSYSIFVLMIGCIVLVAFHPLKRGLHDFLVDSIVVRKGQFSVEKLKELENAKKAKFAIGMWLLLSILVVGGFQYFFNKQINTQPLMMEPLISFSEQIDNETLLDNVGVSHYWFKSAQGEQTDTLIVAGFMKKDSFEQREIALEEANKAVAIVKDYSRIDECDQINVIIRSGFNIGITGVTKGGSFSYSTDGELFQDNYLP